jgi:hypothetical protein
MNARSARGLITTNNVVAYVDHTFDMLLDEVQFLIDDEQQDIPDSGPSKENVARLIRLLAFYGSTYSYLIGLWGALRFAAGSDKKRIAGRDYLEKAVSGCKSKYETTSRILTSYQILMEDK